MKPFFLIVAVLLCVLAKGQLRADFSADVTTGCAPVLVQFTDLSTGNPTSYSWSFGNGNSSTSSNPSTIYFDPGTYTVKLVVRTATAVDSIVKTVTVNENPTAEFSVSTTAGCSPLKVAFSNKSTAGTGSVTQYEWDFGDGTTSTEESPSHIYTINGDFTINLKVTNSNGCSNLVTRVNYIHVTEQPKADFTSNSSAGCAFPVTISFTNTSTGSGLSSSKWNFGDGTTSESTNASHNFTRAGVYDVTLVVINNFGCSDTITKPVSIGSQKADFTIPDKVCQGAAATFVNTSTSVFSAAWVFGDGTSSSENNPTKAFSNPGNYSIKLINNFGGCTDSVTKSITVLPKPSAAINTTGSLVSCSPPLTVAFNANSASVSTYFWDFGDGQTSTSPNVTHTYTNTGNYNVTLIASGSNGCFDTIQKPGLVIITPVKINSFDSLPYKGCFPHTQNFSANITSPEAIATYLWDFGDGTTSADSTPVHNYSVAGSYNVKLKVTSVSGCSDTITVQSAIVLSAKPVAKFSALPQVSCANELVQFTDESTGTVSEWKWEFGDGGVSNEQSPRYHYYDTGYFSIKLFVSNGNCTDSAIATNYIFISPPVAKYELQFDCKEPYVRKFINQSIDSKTIFWEFGDGGSSTDSIATHTYASAGEFIIKLRVSNGTCSDEFIDTIKIIDEHPSFTVDNNENCRNSTLVFNATNINTSNISYYRWHFGDYNRTVQTGNPRIRHTYDSIGIFTPTLTITDDLGCSTSVSNVLNVNIFGPKPKFAAPDGSCVNTDITITDQSEPYPNHPITSRVVNYGDGTIDSSATSIDFRHIYTVPKLYTVTLIVTDSYGCIDSVQRSINITGPTADFSLADSISCRNSDIGLVNNSVGVDLKYKWSFGNGDTATARVPAYSYSQEGVYDIGLYLIDVNGCSDTLIKTTGLLVKDVIADFEMSSSSVNCPPAQIAFSNKSQYYSSLVWDFEDGNNSNIDSPLHYFQNAGIYNIKLVARGHGTCVDSTIKQLTVRGPSGSFNYSPDIRCLPADISFTGGAINNNDRYIWDFGDGTTVTTSSSNITHTYATSGKYLPKLLLRDTVLNCTVSIFGSDTLVIADVKSFVKNIPVQFCDTAGIQFFDSSVANLDVITSYLWKFGDGSTSDLKDPYHNYTTTGNYPVSLTVTTSAGCIDSSGSATVNILKSPQLLITGNTSTCVNEPITFQSGLSEPYSTALEWSWDFKNGNTSSLQLPPQQTYPTAGTYFVKAMVTSTNGCVDVDSLQLQVKPLPNVSAGADSIICLGQSVTLNPTGALTYNWESSNTLSCTNCVNPVASPINSATYIVSGTSAEGCKNIDTINVTVVQPLTINAILSDTICAGESTALWASGADNYTWSPSTGLNNNNIPNPTASPATTTLYTVIGRDYRNCFADTATVNVVVYPIPAFNIVQSNVSTAVGNSVLINTTNSADITNWRWFPGAGLSCINCPQPEAKPTTTTTYTAIATNQGGCSARDQVTIQIFCNNGNVFVPNTFSPNNDGMNDVFFPRGKGIAGIRNLQIYNRWGALVFQKRDFPANDAQSGWDGTFEGKPLDADVFIYKMEVVCSNNVVFPLNGNITLIR